MPIGNLTSQIFANIYLNELDRFVKHTLKPRAYVRYGDDCIMLEPDLEKLKWMRVKAIEFLKTELKLTINSKSDKILKPKHGLKFLGVVISPFGRKLSRRNLKRIEERLNPSNAASYFGILKYHADHLMKKKFHYLVCQRMFEADA